MGEPDEVWTERIHDLTPYKVTKHVMENAGEKAIFLHCLPAFHDLKTKIGKEMGERFQPYRHGGYRRGIRVSAVQGI